MGCDCITWIGEEAETRHWFCSMGARLMPTGGILLLRRWRKTFTCLRSINVDTVIADGRVLKRDGVLTTLDAGRIGQDAQRALDGVIARRELPVRNGGRGS